MPQTPRDDDQKLPMVRRYQFTVRTLLALPVVVSLYGAAATLPGWMPRVTAVLAVTWGILALWSLWRRAFYQLGGLCAGLAAAPVTWLLLLQRTEGPAIAESGVTPLQACLVVGLITGIIFGLVISLSKDRWWLYPRT